MEPRQSVVLVLSMLFSCAVGTAAEQAKTGSFYKSPPLFSTAPAETASLQTITRFGPVGIGIDLIQPAFTMQIRNVEDGSPAAAAGKLKKGQIIETINGQKLADIDPRIQLGNIITDAEATDGVVKLVVKDAPTAAPQEVLVKIPVLGSYSKTWPLNCPKSAKIVRNYADYLARPDSNKGFSGIGMLFLLSTGEDKDLEPVRQWVQGMIGKPAPTYAWHLGYGGIPLTEYYLRTGDAAALPIIQKWVESAAKAEYLDAWAGPRWGDAYQLRQRASQRRRHRRRHFPATRQRMRRERGREPAPPHAGPLLPLRRPRQQPLRRRPAGDELRRQRQERQPGLRHGGGRLADARRRAVDLRPGPRHRRDDRVLHHHVHAPRSHRRRHRRGLAQPCDGAVVREEAEAVPRVHGQPAVALRAVPPVQRRVRHRRRERRGDTTKRSGAPRTRSPTRSRARRCGSPGRRRSSPSPTGCPSGPGAPRPTRRSSRSRRRPGRTASDRTSPRKRWR